MLNLYNTSWSVFDPVAPHVFREKDVTNALVSKVFSESRVKVIYLVDDNWVLKSCISRGDHLRGVNENLKFNESPEYLIAPVKDKKLLNVCNNLNSIVIVDENKKIQKIIERSLDEAVKPAVKFIAEIGNNHQGEVAIARDLIDAACAAGADFVKFQARVLENVYIGVSNEFLRTTDYGTAYTIRQLQEYNLSQKELASLFTYCRDRNIEPICTPFDLGSLNFLLEENLKTIKIASADLSNFEFRDRLKGYTGHILMSTGMHLYRDIQDAVVWAKENLVACTFMHTNSTYPTPYSDVHLEQLSEYKGLSTTGKFGYSGHERGYHVPLAAVALGASYVEKHFSFSREWEGNDHKVSLLPDEFSEMVQFGRDIEETLNHKTALKDKVLSQGEELNQISLAKGLYAVKDISANKTVSIADFNLVGPCVGLRPGELNFYSNTPLTQPIRAGEPLQHYHFQSFYHFDPSAKLGIFGLPCRVRDANIVFERFKPKFLEYHLFSTDLEVNPDDYSELWRSKTFSFHAPEQFDDGFILDLVSSDPEIVARSNAELLRVANWLLKVHGYSGQSGAPKLVVNVGGASFSPYSKISKENCYEMLSEVKFWLEEMGILLRPQTMPPFPWHFGGQGYHNLFVDLDDLQDIQSYSDFKFCLDTSHSWLACEYLNKNFYDEIQKVSAFVDYVHLADGLAPGGEGLQLGQGEIDVRRMLGLLNFHSNEVWWIPEVWKGHLENFKGFYDALKYVGDL